jgi:hypothetical protein
MIVLYGAAGPYLTLRGIAQGIEAKDSEILSDHVDFDRLRENLRIQFGGAMKSQMRDDSALVALGGLVGQALVSGLLEEVVSPGGFVNLLGPQATNLAEHGSIRFVSHRRAVVSFGGPDDDLLKLVMSRRGLSWVLTNIELPKAATDQLASAGKANKPPPAPEPDMSPEERARRAQIAAEEAAAIYAELDRRKKSQATAAPRKAKCIEFPPDYLNKVRLGEAPSVPEGVRFCDPPPAPPTPPTAEELARKEEARGRAQAESDAFYDAQISAESP